jgi:hypothetical protein
MRVAQKMAPQSDTRQAQEDALQSHMRKVQLMTKRRHPGVCADANAMP